MRLPPIIALISTSRWSIRGAPGPTPDKLIVGRKFLALRLDMGYSWHGRNRRKATAHYRVERVNGTRAMKFKRILPCLLAIVFATPSAAQMTFKKAEIKSTYGGAEQGDKGDLVIDANAIRFVKGKKELWSVPSKSLTEIFYSRVSGRRIKTAIVVSPLLLLTKGRKHYLTMSFNDGGSAVGAVEFQLDKSNYRGVLRSLEEVSGVAMKYDQEGIKGTEQDVAQRSGAGNDQQATLAITSSPDGAEVTIDGAYAGTTPRDKSLAPGEYQVKITKKGYADWERKVRVEAGEEMDVAAELEPK